LAYSLGGFHLAKWLDCSIAGAMVVMAGALFVLAWVFGPKGGLLWQWTLSSSCQGGAKSITELGS